MTPEAYDPDVEVVIRYNEFSEDRVIVTVFLCGCFHEREHYLANGHCETEPRI